MPNRLCLWRARACLAGALIALMTFAHPAQATAVPDPSLTDPSNVCIAAAQAAAQSEGVPLSVLLAISLNETGRKRGGAFRPWPYTVNMEGAGHWFDTAEEALAYAEKERARGAVSFDVGCFQINYRWHGEHFQSIAHMFDPLANATYAARFLRTLYQEQGSWEAAAGAYHSRTPEFAEKYAARFTRFRNGLLAEGDADIPDIPDIVLAAYGPEGPPPLPGIEEPRVNTYPLLQAGTGGGLGSLVPIANGAGTALFGAPAQPLEAPQTDEVAIE